jgi:ABC-type iron transport system FetAB permease component
MDPLPNHPVADLGWSHVCFGLTFIAFTSIVSQALQLHIGTSLVFAALRCVVQLTLVATILQRVFAAENFWAVVGIACKCIAVCLAWVSLLLSLIPQVLLNLLGTIEIGACVISSLSTSLWLIHACFSQNKS